MTAYERLIARLEEVGSHVRRSGSSAASAQCPAHDDTSPSLALRQIEGQALIRCHAGCDTADVVAALDLGMADLFDEPYGARYDYKDLAGSVVRSVYRTPDKKFRQSGQTKGTSVLFRLPEVVAAVAAGKIVHLVEGEKDVGALESLGLVGTTAPMGAANWGKVDPSPLFGAKVVVVVDRDEAGARWAEQVHESLDGKAELTFVRALVGKDFSDHLVAGHGVEDLVPYEFKEAEAPARRAVITWAESIEPEPVVWAWEDGDAGRIPAGSIAIAAGREGTGKSSFGIWLAAQITRGTLPGAYFGQPRRVFYLAVEDSWKHTLVPRLMAAGADLSRVGRFDVISHEGGEVTLSLPSDNYLLEREMMRHEVALVVLDPLMSLIGERIDTHRERDVRSALDPLARMADRTGSVLLGIAHFNKGSSNDAASLITGSGAFKNVPRSVFGFARDDSDENGGRVMSQVKNSLGRDDLPSLAYRIESAAIETAKGVAVTGRFAFTGISERSVAEVLRDSRQDPEDREERRDAASWIGGYLAERGGEAPAKDVLAAGRAAGYSEQTMKNARRKVADTARSGFGGSGQVHTWIIRTDTSRGTRGTTNQELVPVVPVPVPMEKSPDSVAPTGAQSGPLKTVGTTAKSGHDCGPAGCRTCGEDGGKAGLGLRGLCVDCELAAAPE